MTLVSTVTKVDPESDTVVTQVHFHLTFPPGYPFLQEFYIVEKLHVVLATTAFGMGIDSPDVRIVYHWGPPNNLELYAQPWESRKG